MNVMLYKEGKGTQVWGKQLKTVIVDDSNVESYVSEGWHKHPDDIVAEKDLKPVVKKEPKKKGGGEEPPEEPQDEVIDEPDNES